MAPVLVAAALLDLGGGAGSCGGVAIVGGAAGAGGTLVGATTFGGPADHLGTGHIGASGVDLNAHPNSFAELGGTTFDTAHLLGGLPYGTPLRVTTNGRSVVLYKRDFGFGQGGKTVGGRRYAIDLWWRTNAALGVRYPFSGLVAVQHVSPTHPLQTPDWQRDPAVGGSCDVAGGELSWPASSRAVTSKFCEPRSYERCHPGVDLAMPSGTPLHAAADGRVILVQSVVQSGGYGNFACVEHTVHLTTCYAHQSRLLVHQGEVVTRGEVIGLSGCTGRCTGPHLHFEVRVDGRVSCPAPYLGVARDGLCWPGSA